MIKQNLAAATIIALAVIVGVPGLALAQEDDDGWASQLQQERAQQMEQDVNSHRPPSWAVQRYLEQQQRAKHQHAKKHKKSKVAKGLKTVRPGALCAILPSFLDQVLVNHIPDANCQPIASSAKVRVLGYETTDGGLKVAKVQIIDETITESGRTYYFLAKDIH